MGKHHLHHAWTTFLSFWGLPSITWSTEGSFRPQLSIVPAADIPAFHVGARCQRSTPSAPLQLRRVTWVAWNQGVYVLSRGGIPTKMEMFHQWEFQDPKMEVLYYIRPYFGGISDEMGISQGELWKKRPDLGLPCATSSWSPGRERSVPHWWTLAPCAGLSDHTTLVEMQLSMIESLPHKTARVQICVFFSSSGLSWTF